MITLGVVSAASLRHTLICLAAVCAFAPAWAELRFDRLFTDAEAAGQGVGAIRAIAQDEYGFIWFGGENGLARYDGVRLKRYFNDPRAPNTLNSNYVRDIQIDHNGVMWIATDLGLCRYNKKTDDFTVYLHGAGRDSISHDVVMSLTLDAHNNLYIGTGNGLNILSSDRGHFEHYFPQPDQIGDTGANSIQSVFIDSRQRIWLGMGESGLVQFDLKAETYRFFQHDNDDPQSIVADSIRDIEEDEQGRLWIGTYSGGISRMDVERETFHNYSHDPGDPTSIGSNTIWDIFQDSEGTLWIGTDPGGLARYDEATDAFEHYRYSPYNRDSISSNVVRTIFEDQQRDLWVGTFPSGVNYYSRAISSFRNYQHKPDDPNSLSHSAVLTFKEDREGLIWIGNEGGLDSFDPVTETFTRHNLRPGEPGGLRANAVLSIEEDINGDLWVGTWSGGLHRYDRETGIFYNYFPDKETPGSINSSFIWALLRDSNNDLWVGTETGGLNLYHRDSDSFSALTHNPNDNRSINSNFLWALEEDSAGNFWVGTMNGLDRFDRATRTFYHYAEIADGPEVFSGLIRIRALAEDAQGRIWIGTQGSGAFVYDPQTEGFTRLDESKGMPSPYVPSIIGDDSGNMWLTTGNGVARVNGQTLDITVFRKGHGLVGNNFNRDATLKDRRGNLYFGGAEGFSVLDPKALVESSDDFSVVITDFKIFNQTVPIGAPKSPLKESILTAEQITLNHTHSMFSFGFSALSYRFSSRNHYAYKLEGFDKDWNYVGEDNAATYTNLGAGEYIFKVKGANGDGVWSDDIATKKLIILPPPWKTWWAYCVYAALTLLLIIVLIRTKTKRMDFENQKALNAELLRVNRIKDTFLANTSHELRTPLNGIIGIAESMADNPLIRTSEELFHRTNLIVFSGKRLSTLINDILDYSKLCDGNLDIFSKPVDLRSLTEDVFQLLGPLTEAKSIELKNAVDESLTPLHADENRLQQIMINLVGNAIKYSDFGVVSVYCRRNGDLAEIVVEDSGPGIPEDQYENVFTAFLQLESSDSRRYGGTGLGLSVTKQLVELHGGRIWVESQLGVGSKFKFTLPFSDQTLADVGRYEPRTHPAEPLSKQKTGTRKKQFTTVASVDDLELQPAPENAEKFTLLIVDDDPVNRLVLSGILNLHHYQIIEACSGLEAIAILSAATHVDLVILDVMMPQLNGYDTCKKIREQHPLHELPVIFLTAKKVDEDIAKAFAAGGTEILTKPVSKYELLPRIANQLKLLEAYRRSME